MLAGTKRAVFSCLLASLERVESGVTPVQGPLTVLGFAMMAGVSKELESPLHYPVLIASAPADSQSGGHRSGLSSVSYR